MEFVFLSRFWGNARRKEVEFSILRSAIASTSHLKRLVFIGYRYSFFVEKTWVKKVTTMIF